MKNKYLVLLSIILLILVLVFTQYKGLTNKYYINNDARFLFIINDFPDNLEDSILAQYVVTKVAARLPFIYLYVIVNQFTDFTIFTKIFAIAAFLLTVIYIFKLGKLIKNTRYALILTILFILYSWTATFKFAGGLARTFTVPLIIAFLYYLIKKDIIQLSIVTVLQATLYPPILLVSLGTYGLSLIDFKKRKINLEIRKNAIFYISIIISIAIISVFMFFITYGFTEQITFKQAINSPEFYIGGRASIFRGTIPFTADISSTIKTTINIMNIGIKRPILTNPLFVLLLLTGIFTFIYRKKILLPREVYFLPLSSILFHFIASLVLFKLYTPNRYTKFSIPIFLMILLAYGLYYLSIQKKMRYLFPTFLIILTFFYIPKIDSGLMYCGDIELYEFIKKLPKETLIAGHPIDMDCIALYGQREPFITYETSLPYFTDYYEIIKNRNIELFSAYYAKDKQTVHDFCKKNEITYLIVNKEHFTTEYLSSEIIYLNPFSDYIKNITKGRQIFYLMQTEDVLFESGNKFIVSCD